MKVPAAWQGGVVVFPQTADKSKGPFTCLGCKCTVYLKRGAKYRAHFAHAPEVMCNESIMHLATKEWIASQASNTDFKIIAACECGRKHTVLRGHPTLTGHTEISCLKNKYKMDVAFARGRVVACIEVYHTHRAGQLKLNEIEASVGWPLPAVEVKSVDLLEAGYPTVFNALESRACILCIRRRIREKTAKAQHLRERTALKSGLKWLLYTKKRRQERATKAWFIWRANVCFKTFLGKVSAYCDKENARIAAEKEAARKEHERRELFRWMKCAKCSSPVEMFRWEDDRKTGCEFVVVDAKTYHVTCSPLCPVCLERRSFLNHYCVCDTAKRAHCTDCNGVEWKSKMRCINIGSQQHWQHSQCGTPCRACGTMLPMQQARYGGGCYDCNRKRKFNNY